MVSTAAREKLLIGRRPVGNWTRRTISSLLLCRKLHLFLGKSTKNASTRAALFDSNMHQIICRLWLCPTSTGGYSANPGPIAVFGGLLLKRGERKGGEGKGRRGEEERRSSSFVLGRKQQSRRVCVPNGSAIAAIHRSTSIARANCSLCADEQQQKPASFYK